MWVCCGVKMCLCVGGWGLLQSECVFSVSVGGVSFRLNVCLFSICWWVGFLCVYNLALVDKVYYRVNH